MANIKDSKPYDIMIGTDNRPGGVEGEYHVQFKPDIMNVTFCEQEEVAKEFGGTMRVSADGQEWADFYHEADAVKFAEKVVGMNQERDLVGRYQTSGMGNDTKFWPDRGTLGIYQAYAFKNNNILIFKDVDDSEGIRLSSLSHEEQKYIMDSIGSLLDRHLITQERNFAEAREHLMSILDSARSDFTSLHHLEQGAKQAIRDRIVTPSARSFTPDQVEVLNHYHQVAAPDKPAGEVFKELLDEVAQEPDIARKPKKWVTDTAKELDDLAEDITRDQSRGLHI